MNSSLFVIAAALALFLAPAQALNAADEAACQKAYDECSFRFATFRGLPTFKLTPAADVNFTTRVDFKPFMRDYRVGIMNSNMPAYFISATKGTRPITTVGKPRFTPNHFKPYRMVNGRSSNIGHETFQGNQLRIARRKCVKIIFTSLQILAIPEKTVAENRNDVEMCVVFKTE